MEKLIRHEEIVYTIGAISALMIWDTVVTALHILLSLYIGIIIVKCLVKAIRKGMNKWILRK